MSWVPKYYTPTDIEILYKGAKDKVSELYTLAELNCCTPMDILDYLNSRTIIVGRDYIAMKKYLSWKEKKTK